MPSGTAMSEMELEWAAMELAERDEERGNGVAMGTGSGTAGMIRERFAYASDVTRRDAAIASAASIAAVMFNAEI